VHDEVDFIHFLYRETADGTWQGESETPNIQISTKPEDMFYWQYALGGEGSSACTKLFRRELFRDLRFAEGIRHEDEELMTRLLPRCHRAVYMDLELYGYVMRSGSIIRSNFHPGSLDIFPIMDGRIRVLQHLDCADLVVETKRRMFQTAAWQYCLARKGGFTKEAARLKEILLSLSKEPLPLSGQYRILHRLAGISPAAVDAYYFVRRLSGKT
jgi:hypothetical protein